MSDDRMTPDEARHDEVLRRLQAVHLGYQISREDMATLAREAAAALLALAEDGERWQNMEPVGHQYLFISPLSGGPTWRDSSAPWNGQKPLASREIFAARQGNEPATEPRAVRDTSNPFTVYTAAPATEPRPSEARLIGDALAVIRQAYDGYSVQLASPREYVEDAVAQLIRAGYLCARAKEIERLRAELDDAYTELRKQQPAMTAVFDRAVHERAKAAGVVRGGEAKR